MPTFKHSGDLGDIIYALPTIRALGGGALYLSPNNTKTKFSFEGFNVIAPLLLRQTYITSVSLWAAQLVDFDLDDFRCFKLGNYNLADAHLDKFGLPLAERDRPWITVDRVEPCDVVLARSSRYHNPQFNWKDILNEFGSRCRFVGLPEEHKAFQSDFGKVKYAPTENFLELARLIAGCTLFVGNQSAPFAIAEGLKVDSWLEVCESSRNCIYERPNVKQFVTYPVQGEVNSQNSYLVETETIASQKSKHKPTLSVVIAAHNEQQHFPAQLEAILKQSRPADELVVLDDGSMDDTWHIIESIKHPRLKLLRNPNPSGVNNAFNTAAAHASSDWLYLASANDLVQPGAFAAWAAAAERWTNAAIMAGNATDVQLNWLRSTGMLSPDELVERWQSSHIHGCATFITRDAWGQGYIKTLGSLADYWLYHTTALRQGLVYLSATISWGRKHKSVHADCHDKTKRAEVAAEVVKLLSAESTSLRDRFVKTMLPRLARGE